MKINKLFNKLIEKNIKLPTTYQKSINFGLLKNASLHICEIEEILKSNKDIKQKQELFENLNQPIFSQFNKQKYTIPANLGIISSQINTNFNELLLKKHTNVERKFVLEELEKLNQYIKLQNKNFNLGHIIAHLIFSLSFDIFSMKFKEIYLNLNIKQYESFIITKNSETTFNNIKDHILNTKINEELRIEKKYLIRNIIENLNNNIWKKNYDFTKENNIIFNIDTVINLFDYEGEVFKIIFDLIENIPLLTTHIENKTGKNKTTFFVLTNEVFNSMLTLPLFSPNLPMLIEPKNWQLRRTNDDNLLSNLLFLENNNDEPTDKFSGILDGGFLKNNGSLKGITGKSRNSFVIPSKHNLEVINQIQKNKYRVNKKMLDDINNNYIEYLIYFLKMLEINYLDKIIIFDDEFKSANILSFEDYYKNMKIDNETKKEAEYRLNLCSNNYKKFIHSFSEYIITVELLNLFLDKDLYFVWFFDLRARLYSLGYLLSPQGNSFSKAVLDLVDDDKISNDYNCYSTQIYYKQIENSNKPKDWFMKRRIFKLKENSAVIPLDASASGISICSMLTGDFSGILQTNVFIPTGNINNKYDIYNSILKKILEEFENLERKNKNNPILQIKSFFTRENVKDFVMCFNYSEGSRSRWLKIQNYLLESKLQSEKICIQDFLISTEQERFIQQSTNIRNAEQIFLECFKKEFPTIMQFKNFFIKAFSESKYKKYLIIKNIKKIKEKKKIYNEMYKILSTQEKTEENKEFKKKIYKWLEADIIGIINNYLIVVTNPQDWICIYRIPEIKKIKYILNTKKQSFTLNKETNNLNTKKLIQGCIPHFVHNLDARILAELVLNLKKLNIPLFSAHDSFYSFPRYCEKIKEKYLEALIKITIIEDPISEYFKFNKIQLNSEQQHVLEEFKTKKNEILKKFKNKELIMNINILK